MWRKREAEERNPPAQELPELSASELLAFVDPFHPLKRPIVAVSLMFPGDLSSRLNRAARAGILGTLEDAIELSDAKRI